MNKTILVLSALSLAGLTGCDATMKMEMIIRPSQSFDLMDTEKKPVHFAAGGAVQAEVAYFESDKRVTLKAGNQEIEFKNAAYDKNTQQLIVSHVTSEQTTQTGERVGLSGSRHLVCDPNCEVREVFRRDQSCIWYDRIPVTVCSGGPNPHCYTRWDQVARSGWQMVEITRVTRRYQAEATIYGESSGRLAYGMTQENDVDESYRELSMCR